MFGLYGLLGSAAAALLIGIGATHYADSVYYGGRISTMKADYAAQDAARTNAELKQFQDISKQITTAATDFLSNQGLLGTKIDTITKDLQNVQAKKPLPANCKPDSNRVRVLSSAIAAANSTVAR